MKREKIRIGYIADYLNTEYSESLINGISTYCQENDIELVIFQIGLIKSSKTGYDYQYLSIASQITQNNLDGIIIPSGTQLHGMSKKSLAAYLKSYKPLKMVSIALEMPDVPSIMVDCQNSFEALISYLVNEQGCRKFGIMGVDSDSTEIKDRTDIIKKVLKDNNISSSNIELWKSNFHYTSAYQLLTDYYTKKKGEFDFDAVVALNDDLAFACVDFISQGVGKSVPDDIIVTGFDDMQRATFFTPTLTTVNQQVYFQGYKAAQVLEAQIKGKHVEMVHSINAKAILRQSTNKNPEKQNSFVDNDFICMDKTSGEYANTNFSVTEWFTKRSQVFQAANLYTYMQEEILLDKIGPYLTSRLRGFGFKAAAVVLYDQPIEMRRPFDYFNLPDKANLVSAFDFKINVGKNNLPSPLAFNPNDQLIPDGFLEYTNDGIIAMALYYNTIQYGYILIRRGSYDMSVYELITRAISNQISESYFYTKTVNKKKAVLESYGTLDEAAHIDYLTGVKNQRGFIDLGKTALKYSESMKQDGMLIYCDVKGVTKINTEFGHEEGDKAIKAVGEILQHSFRHNDIIARVNGDVFAIISSGLTLDVFKNIKAKIETECYKWQSENKSPYEISVTMGFVLFPSLKYGYDLDGLMKKVAEVLDSEKSKKI